MAARRLLAPSALLLLVLALAGCGLRAGAPAGAEARAGGEATPVSPPAQDAPVASPALAADAVPAAPVPSAGPLEEVASASPDRAASAPREPGQVPPPSLADLALRAPDLGTDWLTQQPDDRAADAAEHRFCGAAFSSDRDRRQRVERNHARDDGLRVQQELNRYATAAAAERALREYVDAFSTCGRYESQPGMSVTLTSATPPAGAQQRAGAHMTLTPAGQPPVHATLAVYRTGDLVTVVSVVAEQSATTRRWIDPVTRAALRRARL